MAYIPSTYAEDVYNSLGNAISGRAVTDTLFLSPDGDDSDGSTWEKAFTTIPLVMAAASTDVNDCTLIMVAPNPAGYDVDTTGDPTYTGNYEFKGSHRQWASIVNTHASATSIAKFTGRISIEDLAFPLGSGSGNGLIITSSAPRIRHCGFDGTSLTGAATAIHFDGATTLTNCVIEDVIIRGHVTHLTGILIDNCVHTHINDVHIETCLIGAQIVHASSTENVINEAIINDCATGIDIPAGTGQGQHFTHLHFDGNTANITDAVGGHDYGEIFGELPMSTEPDDFTGVAVNTGDGADTWTVVAVEVRAAATATCPFRITGLNLEAGTSEKYRIRLSADGGTTWFDDLQFEGVASGINTRSFTFPGGTSFIFNAGTQIVATSKSESAGVDNLNIWLKIQEI